MSYECILTDVRGGDENNANASSPSGTLKTGIITLHRPKAMNALNDQLMDELGQALLAFDADDSIGCIIVTGSEKAFAAGADIAAMATLTHMQAYAGGYISRNWETIRQVRKPVIAAVAGFALGGGCEVAMMCDIVLAADNAKFGQPEIKLGIVPGAGGTQGNAAHRPHDGRRRSRPRRPRQPRGAPGQPDGRSPGHRRANQRHGPAQRAHDQRSGERSFRERAVHRRALRAAAVPFAVWDGGPAGGDGCVFGEAEGGVYASVREARSMIR